MKKTIPHLAILMVTIAIVIPIRTAFSEKYRDERRRIEALGRENRIHEVSNAWNTLEYQELNGPDFLEHFLSNCDLHSLDLSDEQRRKFIHKLQTIFDYLRSADFEDYYRLRTEGLEWRFSLSDLAEHKLLQAGHTKETIGERDPAKLAKLVWVTDLAERKDRMPTKLTEVCLDFIAIATASDNSMNTILKGETSKGHTIIRVATNPGFQYRVLEGPNPDHEEKGLFLHLSFFAQSDYSDNAGPVYISLRWFEGGRDWALDYMITDKLLKMNIPF